MRIIFGISFWFIYNLCVYSALWEDRIEVTAWREYLFAISFFGSLGFMLWRGAAAIEKARGNREVELIDGTKTTKREFEAKLWPK